MDIFIYLQIDKVLIRSNIHTSDARSPLPIARQLAVDFISLFNDIFEGKNYYKVLRLLCVTENKNETKTIQIGRNPKQSDFIGLSNKSVDS